MIRIDQKERFKVREIQSGAKTVYEVSGYRLNRERVRRRFDLKTEAETFKALKDSEFARDQSYRPKLTRLSEDQIAAAEKAFSILDGGESLVEAARFYKKAYVPQGEEITARAALRQFLADDTLEAHLRPSSVREIRYNVEALRRSLPPRIHVHEITREHIQAWLEGEKPQTAATKRNKVSSWLNWCLEKGYCGLNVITGQDRPRQRKIRNEKDPEILTLDEVVELMRAALSVQNGALRTYYALHLFGGLRAEEIKRISWDAISMEEGLITLGASVAKTAARRVVDMPDNLKAWIADAAKVHYPIIPKNFQKLTIKVRDQAEIDHWARDIGRHSSVSYYYAWTNDKVKTAAWAGHSVQVLDRHYRGLVTPEQAKLFWKLTPDNIFDEKVIDLKEAVS